MQEPKSKLYTEYPGLMDNGEPIAAKSAFSYVPTKHDHPAEMSVFNSVKPSITEHSTYDRLFNKKDGYNNKLHRDDREHAKLKGLNVNDEENQKIVTSLSSGVYGQKLGMHVDHPDRKHVRIGHVNSEFYSRNGLNLDGKIH